MTPDQTNTVEKQFQTGGGIAISLAASMVDGNAEIEDLVDRLDEARGVLLSSSYEYPGPLHPVGHGLRRSAAGCHQPGAGRLG